MFARAKAAGKRREPSGDGAHGHVQQRGVRRCVSRGRMHVSRAPIHTPYLHFANIEECISTMTKKKKRRRNACPACRRPNLPPPRKLPTYDKYTKRKPRCASETRGPHSTRARPTIMLRAHIYICLTKRRACAWRQPWHAVAQSVRGQGGGQRADGEEGRGREGQRREVGGKGEDRKRVATRKRLRRRGILTTHASVQLGERHVRRARATDNRQTNCPCIGDGALWAVSNRL